METHDFFLYLLVILLTARVFAELATRLQTPAVIGELFAGVVLGPSLLGWIEPVEAIKLMAEIGIILLLFEVGLETDIKAFDRKSLRASGFDHAFHDPVGIVAMIRRLEGNEQLFIGHRLGAVPKQVCRAPHGFFKHCASSPPKSRQLPVLNAKGQSRRRLFLGSEVNQVSLKDSNSKPRRSWLTTRCRSNGNPATRRVI